MPRSRTHFARALAFAIVLFDVMAALAGWRIIRDSRTEEYREAARNDQNLARVIGESLDGSVHLVDLALLEAKDEIEDQLGRRRITEADVETFLERLRARLPFVGGVRTADREGRIRYGLASAATPAPVNVADRDYFLRARAGADDALVVSSPLVSRVTGRRSLVFARRLSRPDGSFDGIVYAVVELEQFTRVIAGVDVGRLGAVVLRDAGMALVARFPARPENDKALGDRNVSESLREALATGAADGFFTAKSPVDHLEKVTAFRQLAGGKFVLIVASAPEEFLAEWRIETARTVVGVFTFVLITVLSALFLVRYWRREADSRFRALVEGAPMAVTLTRGARVLYVNREFARTFGLDDPRSAVGRSVLEAMDPADRARTSERLDRLAAGQPVEPTTEVTMVRPRGGPFRAAITDATVELADGPAVLGFIQDVTQQRRAEADRERLIGDLQAALADVKTLSGLLPICAHCKKVRDDHGYWNRIESFLREHSGAEFTHGICPDCAQKYFPEDAGP